MLHIGAYPRVLLIAAVSRVGGLLAVAVLPAIAGLTGDSFYDPAKMSDGFHMAMVACAVLAAAGGVLAWLTISSEVLEPEAKPVPEFSCAIAGTPLRASGEQHPMQTLPARSRS